MQQVGLWIGFNLFVILMLALDLGVFHRKAHAMKVREALIWTAVWIVLALLFCAGIWTFSGSERALQFLAGYIIEKSLSVDNIFVIMLIFRAFRVSGEYQRKVLQLGILGALVMRAVFILAGIALIQSFDWVIYVFGGFLILTAVKMLAQEQKEIEVERNLVLRILRRFLPITRQHEGERFFVKKERKIYATPLFVALLVVETSDVVFALDSIPAILAISVDTFIVYTSNVFAILGLRSLYFAVSGAIEKFHFLHYGLSGILAFVGLKMLLSHRYHVPIGISLAVIGALLALSILASLVFPRHEDRH